jgi:hypothetical protein
MRLSDSTNAGKRSSDSAGSTWRRADSSMDQKSGDTSMSNRTDQGVNRSTQDSMSSANSSNQQNNSTTQQNSNQQNNAQADASATTTEPAMTDRILMRNDSVLIIQNGEATGLDKEYKLQSGAVVNIKGVVKYPSGKTVQLKNGQFIELTTTDDSKTTEDKADKATKSKSSTPKKAVKTKKSTTTTSKTSTTKSKTE